jgi:lactate permease
MTGVWYQNYNPLGNAALSTIVATVPVLLLFYFLAVRKSRAYLAAIYALIAAILSALLVFRMPAGMVAGAVAGGLVYGVVRVAWVLLAAVFVYELTVETGHFEKIKASIGGITDDRRLQVLLIAFAFGALLEGSGGGGAPVAVTGAMMVGLGFNPFQTALMCLIANSAPVAYGGMGNPIRTLVAVTALPEADLSAMVGRILPLTTLVLPFYLIRVMVTGRETLAVWPGLLACGIAFGGIQFFWSNFVDASLVDIVGGMGTLLLLAVFFSFWKPKQVWRYPGEAATGMHAGRYRKSEILHAWSPFILLGVFVVIWGLPFMIKTLDPTTVRMPVPGLHHQVIRHAPVMPKDFAEPAVFDFAWLSGVGTATFFAGLLAGPLLGLSLTRTLGVFWKTLLAIRYSLIAIIAMMALGYLTRYSGMDAVMGLAMARTGVLFPMFGTLIGWMGVALSGTDAGSNALFGSLQVMTANQLGLSPVLMAAANSAGGVMGKMIAAQSIIVGCAATGIQGREGDVFRAVLKHSLFLAVLIGLIVTLYAYVFPGAIPHGHRFW